MNYKYVLGSLAAIPLLPLLYVQGKRVKSSVPVLPEATGTSGIVKSENDRILKVIVIGESTIAGVGVKTHEEGFSGTLAKELSRQLNVSIGWRVYARSGYNLKKVTYKIIPKIGEEKADLIIIGMGGNDAFELRSPRSWKKDVEEMIDALRQKFGSTPIIFNNMPPIKDFPAFTPAIKFVIGNLVELFGTELQEVARSKPDVYFSSDRITLSDWIEKLQSRYTREDFFSDGVHPSKLTYQTWAREMADFIVKSVPDLRN